MSLRLSKKPPAPSLQRPRRLEVSVLAHNRALHYLANHPLTDDVRKQLIEVVHGYTGRCDEAAARAGIVWMRDRDRREGKAARF
jgi:hypothetical protein